MAWTVSRPHRVRSASYRSAPIRQAAIWAARSPLQGRRSPRIRFEEGHQVVIEDAARSKANQRDPEPFRKVITHLDGEAAGYRPAHVGVVAHRRHVAFQPASVHDRRRHRDVGEVCPAVVGVVEDVEIAFSSFAIGESSGDSLPDLDQHPEMDRQRHRLGDRPALGVEDRRGGVEGFVDHGRVRAAQQHQLHLVGQGIEGTPQHFDGDGVGMFDHGMPR